MTKVVYQETSIDVQPGELVLDALLRQGHVIPYGCRGGVCQSCMMVAEEGEIPDAAQKGLELSQKKLNYFLSCQCQPESDLVVNLPGEQSAIIPAQVVEKTLLNDQVIRLRLVADLDYLPGQYVNLSREDGLSRSYSLASVPMLEDYLEFHIKLAENGQFSGWLNQQVELGDVIGINGPMGKCIFTAEKEQPILMAGISTGLAPLYGLVRQALSSGHSGPIHLLCAAKDEKGIYLFDELIELSKQYSNLNLHFVCQQPSPSGIAVEADVYNYSQQHFSDLMGWRVFLCGAVSFVKKMQKHCFLSRAASKDISADSFLPAKT